MAKKKISRQMEYIVSPERTRQCVLTGSSPFAVTEAYKTTRTNLLFTRSGQGCQKVVITSALVGEGKTVNCINLGITLAQNGLRVLLIDADMRRPQMHHVFNINSEHGLSEILAELTTGDSLGDDANIIYRIGDNSLYVLPAGHIPPNPAELLASPKMAILLKTLEEEFDYILIDSPPISVVTDAAVLTELVSGYVLVVRRGRTPMDALRGTVLHMEQIKANIIGFILNDADAKSSYKRRGYGKYGRYGRYGYYGRHGYGYGYSSNPYASRKDEPAAGSE